MILKYRTLCKYPVDGAEGEYGQEQWHFVDGVNEAITFYDREHDAVCVRITDTHQKTVTIALHDEAYLLNDEGKTIEKVKC